MNKKLLIAIPVVLIALAAVYKLVLAKPAEAVPPPKVHGTVYVLGKEFLINLEDGHFAKLTAALVLAHDDTSTVPAESAHGEPAKPPEGFGPMGQEAVVRDVITDDLTGATQEELVEGEARARLKKAIAKNIRKHSDVKVEEVLFTDVTVQ